MYDQDGPAQTIKTRCSCDVDNLINSAESSPVTTMPANCGANLSLSKTVDDATPDPVQQITYTIIVNNAGPCQAGNVEVTDVVPAGLQYVNGSMTGPGFVLNNAPGTTGLKWQNVVIRPADR